VFIARNPTGLIGGGIYIQIKNVLFIMGGGGAHSPPRRLRESRAGRGVLWVGGGGANARVEEVQLYYQMIAKHQYADNPAENS
jgi:hypothetical protein